MGKYMVGVSPEELEKSFPKGISIGVQGKMWTGYNIDQSDILYIKKLKNNGNITMQAKIISKINFKKRAGRKKEVKEFIVQITGLEIIKPYDQFKNWHITANANHGRIE